jgi:hypothetical protein
MKTGGLNGENMYNDFNHTGFIDIETLLNMLAFPNAFFGSSPGFMPNFSTSPIFTLLQ